MDKEFFQPYLLLLTSAINQLFKESYMIFMKGLYMKGNISFGFVIGNLSPRSIMT